MKNPLREVLGARGGSGHAKKNVKIDHFIIFFVIQKVTNFQLREWALLKIYDSWYQSSLNEKKWVTIWIKSKVRSSHKSQEKLCVFSSISQIFLRCFTWILDRNDPRPSSRRVPVTRTKFECSIHICRVFYSYLYKSVLFISVEKI